MRARGTALATLPLLLVLLVLVAAAACASGGSASAPRGADGSCAASPAAEGVDAGGCGCSQGLNRHGPAAEILSAASQSHGSAAAGDEDGGPVAAAVAARVVAGALEDPRHAEPTPLVRIPGGEFIMGTDDPKIPSDGESPARPVRVSAFDMQQFEVSNRQFAAFVLDTGYTTEAERFGWSFCFEGTLSKEVMASVEHQVEAVPWWVPVFGADWWHPNGPDGDVAALGLLDHPVVHVSHADAKAYCTWIGMRLPREAEFERASRGNLEQALFPWGDELTPAGKHRANLWQGDFPAENLKLDGYAYASPVDSFGPQNEFGVYNIIGNVWEWVLDAWNVRHHLRDPRTGEVLLDPQVELSLESMEDPSVERVKKGGSYMCHISYCYRYRTASRSHNTADSSAQNLGFRCVRDVDESDEEVGLDA